MAHLATVPDPRDRRGVRHRLASLLSVAVCAVLAGARSLAAIGEWAADAPAEVLTALGVPADPLTGAVRPPDDSTVRRVLVGIDGHALDAAVGAWLAGLSPMPTPPAAEPPTPRAPWPAVAVDGKTLRGSGNHTDPPVHLLAAMRHDTTAVLGQVVVAGKSNEITAFAPLLRPLELTHTVVTADALHGQREHAQFLVTVKHAAYVIIIKRNQPHLYRQLKALPWVPCRSATTPAAGATAATRSAAYRCSPHPACCSPTPRRRCASPAAPSPSAPRRWNATSLPTP